MDFFLVKIEIRIMFSSKALHEAGSPHKYHVRIAQDDEVARWVTDGCCMDQRACSVPWRVVVAEPGESITGSAAYPTPAINYFLKLRTPTFIVFVNHEQ